MNDIEKLRTAIKKISNVILTFRWNKEIFFADFGWYFFCVFVKISKKLGFMQKPAVHRKNNFTVLSFFYDE
jgi:hypothetical protein